MCSLASFEMQKAKMHRTQEKLAGGATAGGSTYPFQGSWVTGTSGNMPVPLCTGTAVHLAVRSTSFSGTCGILMKTGPASTFQRADIIQTFFSDHNGIKLEIEK